MKILNLLMVFIFTPVRIVVFQCIWALNNLYVSRFIKAHPELNKTTLKEIESRRLSWRLGL